MNCGLDTGPARDHERVDRTGAVAEPAIGRDPEATPADEGRPVRTNHLARVAAGGEAVGDVEDLERTGQVERLNAVEAREDYALGSGHRPIMAQGTLGSQ